MTNLPTRNGFFWTEYWRLIIKRTDVLIIIMIKKCFHALQFQVKILLLFSEEIAGQLNKS